MTRSGFDRSRVPPARQFYEGEGFRLGRPNSRGWAPARGLIPCHKSASGKSLSINVNHGGFVCFGCGAHGDLVAFVMLRYGCTFKEACQRLGAWGESASPEKTFAWAEQARERDRQREKEAAEQRARHERMIRLRDQLHDAVRDYEQTGERLSELRQGAATDWPNEGEACWSSLADTLTDQRMLETAYCASAGLLNPWSVWSVTE